MSSAAQDRRSTNEEQRRELIAALIPAAQRLLSTGARYPEITVSKLATEAGISRWRFYSHFHDKHELLHAWFEDLNAEFAQTHDAWLHIDGSSTLADLREAIHALFLPYGPHSTLHAAMYDSAAADPIIRAEVDATENQRIESLRAHIARGQAEGWVDPALLALETAEWMVLTGSRSYQRMVVTTASVTTDEFIDSYALYVWHILYAPTRSA